nr:MAG TPA: hypothetical protein [Caudoviricetes sp.]
MNQTPPNLNQNGLFCTFSARYNLFKDQEERRKST